MKYNNNALIIQSALAGLSKSMSDYRALNYLFGWLSVKPENVRSSGTQACLLRVFAAAVFHMEQRRISQAWKGEWKSTVFYE